MTETTHRLYERVYTLEKAVFDTLECLKHGPEDKRPLGHHACIARLAAVLQKENP